MRDGGSSHCMLQLLICPPACLLQVASLRRDNERLRRALAGLLDSPLRVPAALGC